ncbi:hypothetical protein Moror_8480 [Moniliophthora roreri MCA 2997]|uniref:Retrotransposon gag domain-containing protein n=1 Tax=Moniliophthora roreri (strain MCA 2997) TaxID=1381753 RepID=V2XP65_MONRO|nr:hypothetical protein Moror_8480 [Moniliophthora roreri MCA 2997]
MSVPGNFDGTNQQQSQFVPPGWIPTKEHPDPPTVTWTDLYSIYQTVSQIVSDHDKCLYFSTYLGSGAPKEWYNSVELNNRTLLDDFAKFTESFKKHFRDSNIVATAQSKLDDLYQTGSAAQYIAWFNEWVIHLNLTDTSKIHMLYRHLKTFVKDAITFIDDQIHEQDQEKKKDYKPNGKPKTSNDTEPNNIPSIPTTMPSSGEPMEIDTIKVSKP